MPTTWIVAADSSRARILRVVGREHRLVEIQDFVNPKGRMDERELITDAHPRQETTAVEHETELFAKQIDRYLDKARVKGLFDKLHLDARLVEVPVDLLGEKLGLMLDRGGF